MERIGLLVKNLSSNFWTSFLLNAQGESFVIIEGKETIEQINSLHLDKLVSMVKPQSSSQASLLYDDLHAIQLRTIDFQIRNYPSLLTEKAQLKLAITYLNKTHGATMIAFLCENREKAIPLYKEVVEELGLRYRSSLVTTNPNMKNIRANGFVSSNEKLRALVKEPLPSVSLAPGSTHLHQIRSSTTIDLVLSPEQQIYPIVVRGPHDPFIETREQLTSYVRNFGLDFEALLRQDPKALYGAFSLPPSLLEYILTSAYKNCGVSPDLCFSLLSKCRMNDDISREAFDLFFQQIQEVQDTEALCALINTYKEPLGLTECLIVLENEEGKHLLSVDGPLTFSGSLLPSQVGLDEKELIVIPLHVFGYCVIKPQVFVGRVIHSLILTFIDFFQGHDKLVKATGERLVTMSAALQKHLSHIYNGSRRLSVKDRNTLVSGLLQMEQLSRSGLLGTELHSWNPVLWNPSLPTRELPSVRCDVDQLKRALSLVGASDAIDGSYSDSGINLVYETSKKYPTVAMHQLSDVLELSGGAYELKGQILHVLFPYPTLDNSPIDPHLSPVQWSFEDQSLDTVTAMKTFLRETPHAPLLLFHLDRKVSTFEQLLQNIGMAFALIRGQITPPLTWSSLLTVQKDQNLIEQRRLYKPRVIVSETMSEEEVNQLRKEDANLWILLTQPLSVDPALFETSRLLVLNPILLENEKFLSHFDALLDGSKTLTVSTGLPVKRAVVYFEKHVTHALLRWQVAEAAVASEDYLSRCFVRELNLSPFEYFIAIRMFKARSLLRRGNLSVGEVARECGYKDPAYFSRVFRTYFKVLPKNMM